MWNLYEAIGKGGQDHVGSFGHRDIHGRVLLCEIARQVLAIHEVAVL
jgi:hypothetical protein